MRELKGTIPLMTSGDYKERFMAEYYQLKIRVEKLSRLLKKSGFESPCPRGLLLEQRIYMEHLLAVLKRRARIEGITLED